MAAGDNGAKIEAVFDKMIETWVKDNIGKVAKWLKELEPKATAAPRSGVTTTGVKAGKNVMGVENQGGPVPKPIRRPK